MVHLRPHVNVIRLLGACTCGIENRQLFVLTEFCGCGSLLDYLDDHKLDFEPVSLGQNDGDDSRIVRTFRAQPAGQLLERCIANCDFRNEDHTMLTWSLAFRYQKTQSNAYLVTHIKPLMEWNIWRLKMFFFF